MDASNEYSGLDSFLDNTNDKYGDDGKTEGLITQIFGDSDEEPIQDDLKFSSEIGDSLSRPKKRKRQPTRRVPKKNSTVAEHDPNKDYVIDLLTDEKLPRKKFKKDEKYQEELSNKAKTIVDMMFEAARIDRENYENGRIAMEKIKMVQNLRFLLHRTNLYPFYVENRIHLAIAEWLQILPDGKLPNIQIRNVILSILESWPIPSKDILMDSGLGRALKNMTRHPHEINRNREKASQLIYKWGNQIFADKGAHREVIRKSISQAEQKSQVSQQKSNSISLLSDSSSSLILPGDKNFKMRAVQPQPSSTEYKIRPISSTDADSTPVNVQKQIKNMELASRFMRKLKNKR